MHHVAFDAESEQCEEEKRSASASASSTGKATGSAGTGGTRLLFNTNLFRITANTPQPLSQPSHASEAPYWSRFFVDLVRLFPGHRPSCPPAMLSTTCENPDGFLLPTAQHIAAARAEAILSPYASFIYVQL